MAARVPAKVSEFASLYDLKQLPTDQKVGSSNLPGRAIFFKDLINIQIFARAIRYTIGTNEPTFARLF